MKLDPKKTLFIIDGSSFLYRAYYGIKPLHTSTGVPVQAVYSFCRMIKKLITTFKAEYVALVWDSKGKTTRHEIFPAYKQTRQAPPSDLFDQKTKIVEFADLIGIQQVAQQGVEADDLMYAIAHEYATQDEQVVIVSSDKDMMQAITENIVMFDPFKDRLLEKKDVQELMGFPIERLPLYFGLLGDASDNIPGVRGIGKKTAQEICVHFTSMEDLYERLDDPILSERARKALVENRESAFLSQNLFILHNVPLHITKEEFYFNADRWPDAQPLFKELEFKGLLADPVSAKQHAVSIDHKIDCFKKYQFITITTEHALINLCEQLKASKVFALDTETDGLRALQANLVGVSFCMQEGIAYYVPCGHQTNEEQLSRAQVCRLIKPVLEDGAYKKYLHHAKFDQLVLAAHGIDVQGVHFDTLLAAHLLAKDWQRIGLKDLSLSYFDEPMLTYDDMVKRNGYTDFSYVPLDLATQYAACDAHQTWRLVAQQVPELMAASMDSLYYTIELPLVYVLCQMERTGIALDVKFLKDLGVKVDKELSDLKKQLMVFWPSESALNFNSPKQMQTFLFDVLKLPMQRKSAKGGASTDAEVLIELAKIHPAPQMILEYRELFKLKTTYIDALPSYINPRTGKIHTTFNQTLVATGRLSSSEPNLQNIPADPTGHGIEIRAAFNPPEGHVFLSSDYSQIELRVLAHLSQDKNLLHAFLENKDIHAQTASYLFEVSIDQVTHEQRQLGKRINFSILYGLTPYGLSKDLNISLKDAKHYIEKYFAQYPQVSEWMEQTVAQTVEHGYVQTLWGRRRYIPGIYEKNKNLYEQARRVAINTKAQGTAAEVMKKGMVEVYAMLARDFPQASLVLQIHDELLISVPKDQVALVEKAVKKILEEVVTWTVPLVVTTRVGSNWKEVTK